MAFNFSIFFDYAIIPFRHLKTYLNSEIHVSDWTLNSLYFVMFSLGTLIRSQYLRYGNKKFGSGIGADGAGVQRNGVRRGILSFSKQEEDLITINDILTQEYETESVATHCILRYADNNEGGYLIGQTIVVITWVKGEPKHSAMACFLSRSRC